jgi:multimeric flavodoxin WrbA
LYAETIAITSNSEALVNEVKELQCPGAETKMIRMIDHDIKPGSKSDIDESDAWPEILKELLASAILIMASPTWVGQMSSLTIRVTRSKMTYKS